ncbi:unnamed protein product, partial [Discosporangium mesarthrocarpum]
WKRGCFRLQTRMRSHWMCRVSRGWTTRQGALPAKVRPLCTGEEERFMPDPDSVQDDLEEGEGQLGAKELARLCNIDPCAGIVKTSLLPRLVRIMRDYALDKDVALSTFQPRHTPPGCQRL